MELQKTSAEMIRERFYPTALPWRRATSVFLIANGIGFFFVGLHLLLRVPLTYGSVIPCSLAPIFFGMRLDWRSRVRLIVAVEAGITLPLLLAHQTGNVSRGSEVVFYLFSLILPPLVWAGFDPGRKQ